MDQSSLICILIRGLINLSPSLWPGSGNITTWYMGCQFELQHWKRKATGKYIIGYKKSNIKIAKAHRTTCYKKSNIKIAKAHRTTSNEALCTLTGVTPIVIKAEEAKIYNMRGRGSSQNQIDRREAKRLATSCRNCQNNRNPRRNTNIHRWQ